MKRFYYIWAGAFAFTFIMSLSACVKDLDAYPNNPEDFTSENAYGNDYEGYLRGVGIFILYLQRVLWRTGGGR